MNRFYRSYIFPRIPLSIFFFYFHGVCSFYFKRAFGVGLNGANCNHTHISDKNQPINKRAIEKSFERAFLANCNPENNPLTLEID